MEKREEERTARKNSLEEKMAGAEEEDAEGSNLTAVDDLEDEEEEAIGDDDLRPLIGSRAEKSLGLLTRRFLQLLQSARGGIVDLNTVSRLRFVFSSDYFLGFCFVIFPTASLISVSSRMRVSDSLLLCQFLK